jgi:23S rRNA pseudouridine1911/1915/1917 synthase
MSSGGSRVVADERRTCAGPPSVTSPSRYCNSARPVEELDILYEDNHLLAIAKPAMLPTMGVAADRPNLLAIAKEYIRHQYHKPGNVYLGVVSRLDAPVTGVVLLARTSKAASRLSKQFRERSVRKVYWALVEGVPVEKDATLEHYLRHDERHRRVHVTIASAKGAQLARLTYQVLDSRGSTCLLQVEPETGRKHQIRVQLAKYGHPILGDRKYGSSTKFSPGIALHARRLVVAHPVQSAEVDLVAPLPASWRQAGFGHPPAPLE